MNLITVYNNDPGLISGDFDIFLLAREGLSSHYQHETTNLIETIELIHAQNKKAYGYINRFIFENEMEQVLSSINELIDLNVDGFLVNDFGLFLKLRELGFKKPILLATNTTITNHLELEFLSEQGFDGVLTARELTFQEIVDMAKDHSNLMIVPIFGHQIISTSRRQLITAYADLIDKELESNVIYKLRESTRQDYFLVLQDETGTHIFDEKLFVGFSGLNELLDNGVSRFLVDSFNLSTDDLLQVADLLRKIKTQELSDKRALDLYCQNHPQITVTKALWELKTTDKKEGVTA